MEDLAQKSENHPAGQHSQGSSFGHLQDQVAEDGDRVSKPVGDGIAQLNIEENNCDRTRHQITHYFLPKPSSPPPPATTLPPPSTRTGKLIHPTPHGQPPAFVYENESFQLPSPH